MRDTEVAASGRLTRGGVAWALYEGGRMPFVALVTGSVFVPYFALTVVGDPVEGQAQVASFGKIAGMIAALTAPLLGAAIDHLGPRKPWIAIGTLVMAVLTAALWWVQPGGPLGVGGVIALLVAIKMAYSYTETLHNSMLVRAAGGGSLPALSSLSLVLGNLAALASVGFFLVAFTLPERPWFGLDKAAYEHVRVVGPFVGFLLALFAVPLLLWTPDAPAPREPLGRALSQSLAAMAALPRRLRQQPNAALFLLARMVYADATAALTILGAVISAGLLQWTTSELLISGVGRTLGAVVGAALGGVLNLRVGPKRTTQWALVVITLLMVVLVGADRSHVFFFWPQAAPTGEGLFTGLADQIHLVVGSLVSGCILVIATSSRSLLAAITPPQETGAYFGLYALAGTATAWLAPMLVEAATHAFGSQQAGITPIIGLFVLGFLLLGGVKAPFRRGMAAP